MISHNSHFENAVNRIKYFLLFILASFFYLTSLHSFLLIKQNSLLVTSLPILILTCLEYHCLPSHCHYSQINEVLDNKYSSRTIVLDISKVFNNEGHRGLLYKLDSNGITGSVFLIIRSLLMGRPLKVVNDHSRPK